MERFEHTAASLVMQSVIQELQSSGHQIKMITGDSLWTAAEVARQVGMVQSRDGSFPHFFHLKRCNSDTSCKVVLGNFRFVSMIPDSLDGSEGSASVAASDLDRLTEMVESGDASLCISGDALQDLVSGLVGNKSNFGTSEVSRVEDKHALFDPAAQAVLKTLVPLVSVFARHAPRQKEAIVAAINLGGFKTLMCGDGTNDMGKYTLLRTKLKAYDGNCSQTGFAAQLPCVVLMLEYLS